MGSLESGIPSRCVYSAQSRPVFPDFDQPNDMHTIHGIAPCRARVSSKALVSPLGMEGKRGVVPFRQSRILAFAWNGLTHSFLLNSILFHPIPRQYAKASLPKWNHASFASMCMENSSAFEPALGLPH